METALYPNKESGGNMKEEARKNFDRWNNALLSRDAKIVAELYSDNNTFLPTLSPELKKGLSGAEDYFKHFLEKNPSGTVVEEAVQALSSESYLHSGMYDFEIGPEDNRSVVKARFTFVWKKNPEGEWKIIHHHSSVKPQTN